MAPAQEVLEIQRRVWEGSLPLEIWLSPTESRVYDEGDPYMIQCPRLSYLSELLPKLHAFFQEIFIHEDSIPNDGWFSLEEVPLKWHYPLGLLYDLFSGASPYQAGGSHAKAQERIEGNVAGSLPWRLTVHFSDWPEHALVRPDAEGKVFHDAFINSVKEADFLRNGTAKGIMSLSKDDSTALWAAVQNHDFNSFTPISKKLLYAQGAPLRHVPLKVYLPSSPTSSASKSGHLRVVQSLVTPQIAGSREAQTVGSAMHQLIPTIFPSRRTPILAKPVLHGVVIPMSTPIEDLMRVASYPDGWLHVGIAMIG